MNNKITNKIKIYSSIIFQHAKATLKISANKYLIPLFKEKTAVIAKKESYVFSERNTQFYSNRPQFLLIKEHLLANPEKNNILDIGCNAGHVAHLIAIEFTDKKVIGIDLNKEAIRYANKTYSLKNTEFAELDALSDEFVKRFRDEKPDVIYCFETIEHLYNSQMRRLFKNITSITSQNTTIIFSTPNQFSSFDEHHVQFFDLPKLKRELESSFLVERIGIYNYNPYMKKEHNMLFAICYPKEKNA